MKTRDYVEHKTGHRISQPHPTAGLVIFNDSRSFQEAVIGTDGSVTWTRQQNEPFDGDTLPYEEEFEEV